MARRTWVLVVVRRTLVQPGLVVLQNLTLSEFVFCFSCVGLEIVHTVIYSGLANCFCLPNKTSKAVS